MSRGPRPALKGERGYSKEYAPSPEADGYCWYVRDVPRDHRGGPMSQVSCPLCGRNAQREMERGRDAYFYSCELCGRYVLSRTLEVLVGRLDAEERALLPYLRAHTRQTTEAGQIVTVNSNNWKDLALGHKSTTVSEKLNRLLQYLGNASAFAGAIVKLDFALGAPLFDAVSEDEVGYLVDSLGMRNDIVGMDNFNGGKALKVTPDGWARLEPTGSGGTQGRCFVAMSFDASLKDSYESGIRLGIKDAGCEAVRVDEIAHNGKICDRIVVEIRLAQFVVADVTLQRQGVYFEAGFAMGLGRPVVWTCRNDDLRNAHFDTRQYNHIEWETPAELRTKLADRIRATILR